MGKPKRERHVPADKTGLAGHPSQRKKLKKPTKEQLAALAKQEREERAKE